MGGNATKDFGSQRVNREQYNQAVKQWLNAFSKIRKQDIKEIPCFENKDDFGDIDFLVLNSSAWNLEEEKKSLKSLNEFDIKVINGVKNGDVLSLAVKFHKVIDSPVIQVDLISAQNNTEFEFAYHYFAFNDLGALIGKVAKYFDFKFGHNGLFVVKYTNKKGKVCKKKKATNKIEVPLNMTFEQAINFLGFDVERYKKGFSTTEEIFKFIQSGKYYHQDFYLLSELNSKERRRDEKRKNIVEAEAYFLAHKSDEAKSSIEEKFIKNIPNSVKTKVHKALKEHKSKIAISRRLNQSKLVKLVKNAINVDLTQNQELLIQVTKMIRETFDKLDSKKVMMLDRKTLNRLLLQQIMLSSPKDFGYLIESLMYDELQS